jgi:hypothetical protein
MIKATDGEPPREFPVPADIRLEKVNPISGSVAGVGTRQPVLVALRTGQAAAKDLDYLTRAPDNAAEASEQPTKAPEKSSKIPKRSTIVEQDLSPDR